ncbi:ABC transporter permease [Neisseria sp. Dent CA1/247]|uniref:ABC transporter permease n=1 Tax=Neisseria zoodegmatis TaxID=326523 RepID=A0AB38DPU5_9NEIS|nr:MULTISPECIES: methionine ABC transporter permease [Neisseria]MDO5070117.1 methionine ABC transporter permease [Neisseria zoodegmatis]OSI09068.1 methionine ABC transporter ATP-binding protein [Neisseria zoodegmatis]UOO76335.1 ABC transporter permease [Neisseria sp. Dent CA1/247]SNU79413.1 ABC transporter permease [Neisseria zoodegmatis]
MADMTFAQAVENISSMRGEIVQALWETFIMVGLSTTFATLFGTLLGVFLFVTANRQLHYNRPVNLVWDNLVNLMRAFPFVILMIAMIPATRAIVGSTIGPVAASLVLSVSGMFYFARLVEQNLREVPRGVIEAASSMGATPMTIIRKVLLNEARAGMVSSITVLAIGLLSYSAAAGMIGGGGLGDLAIRYGYYRYQTEVIIFIVAILVLLVILIQSLGNFISRKLDKR